MKVLVVSGFLGAGKTTFITEMARRSRKKFVVIENEMGAVGVDGGFLSSSLGQDFDIWELTQGCICCSMKADFAASVLTIENVLQPDFLLVEPTGVGMLGSIMDNLRRIAYERIELLSPITVLDSTNWRQYARDFPDIFFDQIENAGTVIFSKAEHLAKEERLILEKLVRKYAPKAAIVSHPYAGQTDRWWDDLWRKAPDGSLLRENSSIEAGADLAVVSLEAARIPSPAAMTAFLEDGLRGRFGSLIRAKGTVSAGNSVLRFDIAGAGYCLTGTEAGGTTQAVFIGRELDTEKLCLSLSARKAGYGLSLDKFTDSL
ncbi:MAG: GTP-binding protein [Mailhella sp.]|nr:GTP-binding protein [Mailhella sp.]